MEESLEIYKLRLEHKRFLEDAEQERAGKEDMRAKLVAEMELRAGVERANRELKNENMVLKLKLEKFERLERAGEVRALSPLKTPSPKKTGEVGDDMDVIEILDSDDDEKMKLDAKPSPKKPVINNVLQTTPTRKHDEVGADDFDVAMGQHSERKAPRNLKSTSTKMLETNDGKDRIIKLKPESPTKVPMEAASSTTKKRGLTNAEEIKEAKKPKVHADTAPLPPRDKGKRREDLSSRNSPPSSFLDSPGELGVSPTSSVMGDLDAGEMRQSPTQTKSWSVPTSKAPPRAKGGSGKRATKGTLKANTVSTSKSLAGSEVLPPPKKLKDEGDPFVLNPERASDALSGLSSLAITPPALQLKLPRQFLTNTFGMPLMGFLWDTHKKKESQKKIPGRNFRFILATYKLNPNMPSYPGGPGLLLSCRKPLLGSVWSLFAYVRGEKTARWNYLGEYNPKKVGELTAEEFQNQVPTVRQKWGEKIATHQLHPEYKKMRARITLRKRNGGEEPTEKAVGEEIELMGQEGYESNLSEQDVIDAFDRGEESISIVAMECVSYNAQFAQELAAKLVPWTKASEEKKNVKPATKKGKSKGGREESEEEDEESDERPLKKSKGKRSAVNDKTMQGARGVITKKMPIRNSAKSQLVVASPPVEEDGSESDIGSDSGLSSSGWF